MVAREKEVFVFSIAGLFALLGFYMFFGPEIILGKLLIISEYQSKYMPLYFFGNLLFWLITAWWFVKLFKKIAFNNFPFMKFVQKNNPKSF